MKRVIPFVLFSILLSFVVSRLAASGRLATVQARFEELCEAFAERATAIPAQPAMEVTTT